MEIFWRRQALKSFWIAQWNSLQKPARSSWCNPNIFDSRIDPESEFVVLREGFLKAIQNVLKMQPGALLTAGPPCASFTFINQGTSKRSRQRPFGNCLLRYVAAANQTLVFNNINYIIYPKCQRLLSIAWNSLLDHFLKIAWRSASSTVVMSHLLMHRQGSQPDWCSLRFWPLCDAQSHWSSNHPTRWWVISLTWFGRLKLYLSGGRGLKSDCRAPSILHISCHEMERNGNFRMNKTCKWTVCGIRNSPLYALSPMAAFGHANRKPTVVFGSAPDTHNFLFCLFKMLWHDDDASWFKSSFHVSNLRFCRMSSFTV